MSCTAGFLLRDATNETHYLLTAGHCSSNGSLVRAPQLSRPDTLVGKVIYDANEPGQEGLDYALIKLEKNVGVFPGLVEWGGPTREIDTQKDLDQICYFGHGLPEAKARRAFRLLADTRDNSQSFLAAGVANGGDSGGPAIDCVTGAPLGIMITGLPIEWIGIMVPPILEDLASAGFDLRIAPAPFVSPSLVPTT